jgi:hypothetical protein
MPIQRIAKNPPPVVEGWVVYLKRAIKIRRVGALSSEDRVVKTAARIALFGSVGEPRSLEIYQALVPLILTPDRIKRWDDVLRQLPVDRDGLLNIVKAVRAAGGMEPFEKAKFDPVYFVKVTSELPDPFAYVDVCRRESHKFIRSAFHPNTLEYMKGKYKGVLGQLADPGYAQQVAAKVKTVS